MNSVSIYQRCLKILGSKKFFYTTVGIFIFSALWLVFTSRYPMAFDENYHYGIIQQYAKQWSPFFSHPPNGSEALGDITRFPSYLFHYLLSFPYRILSLFGDSDIYKIISLRLINVGMFAAGIVIFRRLLLKARLSAALTHIVLFFFVMIPSVPFLAAHINYDNMLIPLTALLLLLALTFIEECKKGVIDSKTFTQILILNLFMSVIKFTHLPVFFAVEVFLVGFVLLQTRKHIVLQPFKQFFQNLWKLSVKTKIVLALLLIIGGGLFLERYGINVVKYKTLVPDCAQVVSVESCKQYGPWARDYDYANGNLPGNVQWGFGHFIFHWFTQNMYELFFVINYDYSQSMPLILPLGAAWIVSLLGVFLAVFNWRKLKSNPALVFFGFTVLIYTAALWQSNYSRFLKVDWPVAIHGRYLLPLAPLILTLLAYGFLASFNRLRRNGQNIKLIVLLLVTLFFLQGGGISSYILKSNKDWYWKNNIVVKANDTARIVLEHLIVQTSLDEK